MKNMIKTPVKEYETISGMIVFMRKQFLKKGQFSILKTTNKGFRSGRNKN